MKTDTKSPGCTRRRSTGPKPAGFAPRASPDASVCRVLPRRNSTAQVTPAPHSACARVIVPSTRNVAATGLCQPIAAFSVFDGCTATPRGFMLPGTRTCCVVEAFASSIGNCAVADPQPCTKSYSPDFSIFFVSRSNWNSPAVRRKPRKSTHAGSPVSGAVNDEAVTANTRARLAVNSSARAGRSRSSTGSFLPAITMRGSRQTAKSPLRPSPASCVTRWTAMSLPDAGGASLCRNSCCATTGSTASIHAFGPSSLPIWPTLLNFHSVSCQRAISAIIASTSAALAAFFHRARSGSINGDGLADCSAVTSAARYFALRPFFFATASTDPPLRSASEAVKYRFNGNRPPRFLSSAIPCCVTVSAPPASVNCE